jgi:hypothetical protein
VAGHAREDRRGLDGRRAQLPGEGHDHLLHHRARDLEVEEQAPRLLAVAERLQLRERGGRQRLRARREVEDVPVPVQRREGGLDVVEEGVARRAAAQLHLVPADLLAARRAHRRAEGRGQQLRAQADAQDGAAGVDGLPDQPLLRGQGGMLRLVVDAHRAAHDDQAGGVAEPLGHGATLVDADEHGLDLARGERGGDQARAFGGRVLQDEDPLAHAITRTPFAFLPASMSSTASLTRSIG